MTQQNEVLTAAQMRAAEEAAIAGGTSVEELMQRAGDGAADWVWRIAAGHSVTVLCGPGNNGGDGYVLAETLRRRGGAVKVVAAMDPATDAAKAARAAYRGEIVEPDGPYADAAGSILVDCLFGTGLKRRLSSDLDELFFDLAKTHRRIVAVDIPSGIDADSGTVMARWLPDVDVTLALGALKPAHVLPSARRNCGELHVVDLGLDLVSCKVRIVQRPSPPALTGDSHKYNRGMVGVVAGEMPGAAILAATAAARAGAGYVAIYGEAKGGPAALVHRPLSREALCDERLGAVIVGPGLGRSDAARELVEWLLAERRHPLVIDADALQFIDAARIARRAGPVVLTPHYGEFWQMRKRQGIEFDGNADVLTRFRAEAEALAPGAVMVEKGSTTYVMKGDEMRISPRGNPWLSTAGAGDVLAGAIGAMVAAYGGRSGGAFEAAAGGVWLHAKASRLLGGSFIADDLAEALSAARASL